MKKRIPYRVYKKAYPTAQVVNGSYDAETKTVVIDIPEDTTKHLRFVPSKWENEGNRHKMKGHRIAVYQWNQGAEINFYIEAYETTPREDSPIKTVYGGWESLCEAARRIEKTIPGYGPAARDEAIRQAEKIAATGKYAEHEGNANSEESTTQEEPSDTTTTTETEADETTTNENKEDKEDNMNTTYKIQENQNFNSREVYFDGKPEASTREALKALKMRWNPKKACWYGYATENAIVAAILGSNESVETPADVVTDGYLGGGAVYGSKSNQPLYGADLSAAIRSDIKKIGIKGVTVKAMSRGTTDHIKVTVTTEPTDIKTKSEYIADYRVSAKMRWLDYTDSNGKMVTIGIDDFYHLSAAEQEATRKAIAAYTYNQLVYDVESVNHYRLDSATQFSASGIAKLKKILDIVQAYRYDESNAMVDYFNTNFYFDIYTKPGKWIDTNAASAD